MENPINMDDLGVDPFLETTLWIFYSNKTALSSTQFKLNKQKCGCHYPTE
jgi:hypothetical protein